MPLAVATATVRCSEQPIEGSVMLAYTYPLLDIFWTMLWFFCFFIYIWLLVIVFSDIFRSHDMGGWAKAGWVIFVIVLPFLGILVYLIARGGKMHERQMRDANQAQKEFDSYVRSVADSGSSADQLEKLAKLKQQGTITDAEFEAQKAKILS
jgi:Short C-terminal domain/Phospholipase_D-nuclease N-terminal